MFRRLLSAGLALMTAFMLMMPAAFAASGEMKESSGIIRWEELEEKIRTGNLTFLSLDKNAHGIESVDYSSMYYNLKKQIDSLSKAQSFMFETGDYSGLNSLNASTASLITAYKELEEGKPQRDSENSVNQLRNAQNQVICGAKSLYINILSLEQSLRDGERGVDTLDRSLAEIRLRNSLGQVSKKTVEDLEHTRETTLSSLDALKSTISSCKAQLQLLTGEEPDGELELGELPKFEGNEASTFDVESDLAAAKEKSWEISNARLAAEKAKEEYEDGNKEYERGSINRYQVPMLKYSAEAAEISYKEVVQNFEFSFKEAHRALKDAEQQLKNKRSAVEYQKKLVELSAKQYELGRISYFAYLSAEDALKTAESEEMTAERDAFAALNKYRNAVEYGIIA